jgi:hypothetical protein
MKDMSEVKSDCFNYPNGSTGVWLYLNTKSIKAATSGFTVKNYYKNQSFNCGGFKSIGQSDSRNQYFVSYRDFSAYTGANSSEESWTTMRQFRIYLTNSYFRMQIDKKKSSEMI